MGIRANVETRAHDSDTRFHKGVCGVTGADGRREHTNAGRCTLTPRTPRPR
ncbi:hypothetical protein B005_4001 [Nocardiopsis alba ATCC BAA-2165]|uniref:Uncharacterized protein n=1 Tax=Nocardiopsis alba (strain ATCC BAA-2165 / BE74) TaxID=1205910 RepID=J7LIV7_NOCAA|nr:hypothetical protein B005_4001 [Nocardiopsis alba ATCC BAA-2165]